MARFLVASIACLAAITAAQSSCTLNNSMLCDEQSVFSSAMITPTILPTFAPLGVLTAAYPSLQSVAQAQQLDPARVNSPPVMYLNVTNSGPFLNRGVLVLIDPDAANASSLNWMVSGIAINYATGLLGNGTAIAPYVPPTPQGTTAERFIFVLYEQPPGWNVTNITMAYPTINSSSLTADRQGFSLSAFAGQYNLSSPLAGLYFESATNTGGAATTTSAGTAEAITDIITLPQTVFTTSAPATKRWAIRDTPAPTAGVLRLMKRKRGAGAGSNQSFVNPRKAA